MRLAACALLALVLLPALAVADETPLERARGTQTVGRVARELEGAAPRFWDIVPEPFPDQGVLWLEYMAANQGVMDFDGVLRMRSMALGIDATRPFDLGSGWINLGYLPVDLRSLANGSFDLEITLEDGRGVVEQWSRTLRVPRDHPCADRAALGGSGGMRHVVPLVESTRYGILLCNGDDGPRSARIVLRDRETQRPIVGALTFASFALETGRHVMFDSAPANPYAWTVEPGWYSTLHYTLEEIPGVRTLEPEAVILWDDGRVDIEQMDVVTYSLGDDFATLADAAGPWRDAPAAPAR